MEQAGQAFGRGVGAVGGAEGVVDVEIAESGQFGDEGRVVGFLAGMVTQVLHQGDAAVFQLGDDVVGGLADAVFAEQHRLFEQGRQRLGDGG